MPGWGSGIRNWLSKRREYSRSPEPETESGLGPVDGVFTKCRQCGQTIYERELSARFNVCPNCEFHYPLPARDRVRLLLDSDTFEARDKDLSAADPLGFEGYGERLEGAREKAGLEEAVLSGIGDLGGRRVALAVMDFGFIGGSMGSVVGEKVARTVEAALSEEAPLVVVSASGGARMFEGVYSLMQLSKTSVALSRYMDGSWPFVSVLTDPTFGGVTASLRHRRRYYRGGAGGTHRFRRGAGYRADYKGTAAGRLPDSGVPERARDGRPHSPPPGVERGSPASAGTRRVRTAR